MYENKIQDLYRRKVCFCAVYKVSFPVTGSVKVGKYQKRRFQKIRMEVILKRAKLRAMHLLEDMDRTEASLREKLRQGLYPQNMIDMAIEYVKSFGYLNDARYAENFIRSRQNSKSRKEIQAALLQKGVSSELIGQAMELC